MSTSNIPELSNNKILFKKIKRDPAIPGAILPCLMCGKPFMMPVFIGVPDQMCEECKKVYADTARVVCNGCKATVCRLAPKLLSSGYYIRPHSILHINSCAGCSEGCDSSTVLEIDAYERLHGRTRTIIV